MAVAVAAAATLSIVACSASSSTTSGQTSFSFSGTHLVIDAPSSDLQVTETSGSGIQVQRFLSGTAATPGHASWQLNGDTLQLSIDCSGLVFSCGSRFQVAVPSGTSVVVQAGAHNVTVSGLSGSVDVEGGSGQVQLTGISGHLQVSTGSGSITAQAIRSPVVQVTSNQGAAEVDFVTAPQLVNVKCLVGNATVKIPVSGHQYRISVTSDTGTAKSQVPNDPQSSSVVQVASGNGSALVIPAS